jgi:hypothetical protein
MSVKAAAYRSECAAVLGECILQVERAPRQAHQPELTLLDLTHIELPRVSSSSE